MTIYRLIDTPVFPDPQEAEPDGLLAVGGDLTLDRLITAYWHGIFPWYNEDSPILWWSPDPRMVLFPKDLHVSRSLRRVINSDRYRITFDACFESVIAGCANTYRDDQEGTWLTEELQQALIRLHKYGLAHSVEAWDGDTLAGGLYGIGLGRIFYGESMFYCQPDASKVAFVHLVRRLEARGFLLIDCQQKTDHLSRFGAYEIPRADFLKIVEKGVLGPSLRGSWQKLVL